MTSLAKELLNGEFEFVVSTHCDKLHKHNHIVFNSVSFIDGKKFHGGADIFHRIQRISDKLCCEYGLSVIAEKKERGKSYAEYRADKQVESRIKLLKPQINDIDTFRKNKPVVEKINAVVFKEKYRREHEKEFILFEAAKKSLKTHFPDGKYPLIKTLRAELNSLYAEKEKLYSEYNFAKEEYKNISANKSVVDFILSNPHEKESRSRGRNGYELE